jgi:hypothetical protein
MLDLSCPLCGAPIEMAKLACPCCKRELEPQPDPKPHMFDVTKAYCHACQSTFPSYLLGLEERALIAGVQRALKNQDEGRNSSCWPLVSFGWKHADLDAEGCTGIKKIVDADGDKLVFEIGGHKTFVASDCLDTDDEEKRAAFDAAMQDVVCSTGYSAEWTGDDWCVSFSNKLFMAIVRKDSVDGMSEPDFEEMAKQIILAAEQLCRPFEEAMAAADVVANEIYKEMNKPAKKPKAKKVAKKSKTKRVRR